MVRDVEWPSTKKSEKDNDEEAENDGDDDESDLQQQIISRN